MCRFIQIVVACLMLSPAIISAKEFTDHNKMMDHGDGHLMDMDGGIVMGQNIDRIPDGCSGIAGEKEITVHAGYKYAKDFPGRMFAFDTREYHFEPCIRLTINFVNDDDIRHQWMMHGLPRYIYPKGMFHMEITGPGKITGSLILPPGNKTYLVHCDLAQHMEKGMKGQLKVGSGSGDLPSIPGVTPYVIQDSYINTAPKIQPLIPVNQILSMYNSTSSLFTQFTIFGLLVGLAITWLLAIIYKGKSVSDVIVLIAKLVKGLVEIFSWFCRKILLLLPAKKKPK